MKTLLSLALVAITFSVLAQERKNNFSLVAAIGKSTILQEELVGGPSYEGKTSYEFGFAYYRSLTHRIKLETGLTWHQNDIKIIPNVPPNADVEATHSKVQLLYIPIFARINFSDYFFIQGGALADIDVSSNSKVTKQSGVGFGGGLGVEFPVKKLVLVINPYLNVHGVFTSGGDQYPQKVLDNGIRIGIRTR